MPNDHKNQRGHSRYDSNGGEDVEDGSNRSFHCNEDSSPYTVLPALLDVCRTQICILVYKAGKPPTILSWGVCLYRLPPCMLEIDWCWCCKISCAHRQSHCNTTMLPNWDWTALQGMSMCMYRKRRWTSFTWVSDSLGLDNGCCEHCTTQSFAITVGDFAIQLGQDQTILRQLVFENIYIQPSTEQNGWILPSIFNLDSDLLLGRHVNNSICKASVHYKTPTSPKLLCPQAASKITILDIQTNVQH